MFSLDYATARMRFRQAISVLGWQAEAHSIGATGPDGEDLTIDVGYPSDMAPDKVLVVSSGLHGVEGFFGSAVQLALLERWGSGKAPPVKCVFLHGLNPYGFAWLRRFDENNVDPNRNFLLKGERYEGFPAGYAELDRLLNPRRPPSRWEPFSLKALFAIARYGMPTLKQAIAAGQYEFPRGLFFGGTGPTWTHQVLSEWLVHWLYGSRHVMHLDLHTGLGPFGACKLLIDYPLDEQQRHRLTESFGDSSFEESHSSSIAYETRGGLGRWCVSRKFAPDYLYACAEFGTYGPVQVLGGLRAENQAHHWGNHPDIASIRARQQLKELFCPSSETWRSRVIRHSLDLVDRAIDGFTSL